MSDSKLKFLSLVGFKIIIQVIKSMQGKNSLVSRNESIQFLYTKYFVAYF